MAPKGTFAKLLYVLFGLLLLSSCQYFRPLVENQLTFDKPEKLSSELVLRQDVVEYGSQFIGTKYKYGGKSSSTGFDCSGFVCHVLKDNGITISGPSYQLENLGKVINLESTQPGDLLFFRKSKSGKVFHVAMVASNNGGAIEILHATSGRGVVVDVLQESSYWNSKIISARDVIGEKNLRVKALP